MVDKEEVNEMKSGLNVNDIASVVRIIDIASERGAWQGGELTDIGQVRDKFADFVKEVEVTQSASVSEDEVETEDEVLESELLQE